MLEINMNLDPMEIVRSLLSKMMGARLPAGPGLKKAVIGILEAWKQDGIISEYAEVQVIPIEGKNEVEVRCALRPNWVWVEFDVTPNGTISRPQPDGEGSSSPAQR